MPHRIRVTPDGIRISVDASDVVDDAVMGLRGAQLRKAVLDLIKQVARSPCDILIDPAYSGDPPPPKPESFEEFRARQLNII